MLKRSALYKCNVAVLIIAVLAFGIALIAVGALGVDSAKRFRTFTGNEYQVAPIFSISFGSLIIILGLVAACGAITKKTKLLVVFIVAFYTLFCIEIGISLYGLINRNGIRETLKRKMTVSIEVYYNKTRVRESWDYVQETLKCCGVHNSTDYESLSHKKEIPASCCDTVNAASCVDAERRPGCLSELFEILSEYSLLVALMIMVAAFVQLLAVTMAAMFVCGMLNDTSLSVESSSDETKKEDEDEPPETEDFPKWDPDKEAPGETNSKDKISLES